MTLIHLTRTARPRVRPRAVVRRVLFGVCRLLLALLIAAKLEGRFDGDWWATFAPIWAAVAMLALCSVGGPAARTASGTPPTRQS